MNDNEIWQKHESEYNLQDKSFIDLSSDLFTLSEMIHNYCEKNILVVLPPNLQYVEYSWTGSSKRKDSLKNLYWELNDEIHKRIHADNSDFEIVYEKCELTTNIRTFKSDFYFALGEDVEFEPENNSFPSDYESVLKSTSNSKDVAIKNLEKPLYLTTLSVSDSFDSLYDFLKTLSSNENEPVWVKDVCILDDKDIHAKIKKSEQLIKKEKKKIEEDEKVLSKNNYWKKVLYTSGAELVEVVFKILDCDLSEFVDNGEEDFVITKKDIVFIGEIKGVNTGIQNKYISQLDVHYQSFLERERETKPVKAILIINYQKERTIAERDEIHAKQLSLAKRNGSLILDTFVLLKLYEKHINGDLSSTDIIKLLKSKTIYLSQKDF